MVVEAKNISFSQASKQVATTGPLNILILATPIAFLSFGMKWSAGITFVFSMLALCPLAERLGYVTEQISLHTNETVGGLLNASFGNATELIVAISALSKGLYRLVQLSLLGSIISNLLLVLGTAFLFGGMKHKTQNYGTISSTVNSTLLMVSTMGILFPTLLQMGGQATDQGQLIMSRATSVVLLLMYLAFLYFQLSTHKHLYEDQPKEPKTPKHHQVGDEESQKKYIEQKQKEREENKKDQAEKEKKHTAEQTNNENNGESKIDQSAPRHSMDIDILDQPVEQVVKVVPSTSTEKATDDTPLLKNDEEMGITEIKPNHAEINLFENENGAKETKVETHAEEEEEEEEGEEDELGYYNGLIWLTIITAVIAVLSEAISDSIQEAADSAGISGIFIAAILLPIVGNAAEHGGAVVFAMKGKLNLTLGVAIGSSTQIALFVLPLLVIIGWMINRELDMSFGGYETGTIFLTIIATTFAIKDGTSNWLIGAALISAYVIISIGFLAHIDDRLDS